MNSPEIPRRPIGTTEMLIIFVAILGFAFDIYELLMMPLIAGPAISELLKVPLGDPAVRKWVGYIFWGSESIDDEECLHLLREMGSLDRVAQAMVRDERFLLQYNRATGTDGDEIVEDAMEQERRDQRVGYILAIFFTGLSGPTRESLRPRLGRSVDVLKEILDRDLISDWSLTKSAIAERTK